MIFFFLIGKYRLQSPKTNGKKSGFESLRDYSVILSFDATPRLTACCCLRFLAEGPKLLQLLHSLLVLLVILAVLIKRDNNLFFDEDLC